MEAIQLTTTVQIDGVLSIPELRAGETVEVIILRKPELAAENPERPREFGWMKGKIRILPGFDDPIEGM